MVSTASLPKFVQQSSVGSGARALFALVALVGVASPALAQLPPYYGPIPTPTFQIHEIGQVITDNRTANWNILNYGNGNFGGSVGADASARRMYVDFPTQPDSPSNYRSAAGLYSNAKIFGQTFTDVARFGVEAVDEPYTLSNYGASPKSTYQANTTAFLKLAGATVWSESVSSVSLSKTWSKSLGPYDTPWASLYFTLGIVPLQARARAGASANVSFTASANVASVSLNLAGHAQAEVHGTAQLLLNGLFAKIGISGDLKFGNPVIDASLGAGIFSGITGTLDACMTPVHFVLKAFAEIGFWKWLKRWETTLVDWSTPQVCVHKTL